VPTSVVDLLDAAGLDVGGAVPWGKPLPSTSRGVYIVSLESDPSSVAGALDAAPLSFVAVDELLLRRPELTLDGVRPTPGELIGRLSGFWLPDEVVLYIGLAGTSLGGRVDAYYRTPLGAPKSLPASPACSQPWPAPPTASEAKLGWPIGTNRDAMPVHAGPSGPRGSRTHHLGIKSEFLTVPYGSFSVRAVPRPQVE
jgi:hypothetical protein